MRAQIVEDRGTIVEHRLDVDELPGPVPFAEDALAQAKRSARIDSASGAARSSRPAIRSTPC